MSFFESCPGAHGLGDRSPTFQFRGGDLGLVLILAWLEESRAAAGHLPDWPCALREPGGEAGAVAVKGVGEFLEARFNAHGGSGEVVRRVTGQFVPRTVNVLRRQFDSRPGDG